MSFSEKGVFVLLAASVGLGTFQLATSPWGKDNNGGASQEQRRNENENDSRIQQGGATFGDERISNNVRGISAGVDDGMSKVASTVPTPKVHDGVTSIQFGDETQSSR